jgi:hypothetical protein
VVATSGLERMTLLREIQDAATGNDVPLTVLLRKCRVLAQRLGNDELRQWTEWELNGYPDERLLPPYRKESAEVRGQFAGPFGRELRNAPIPRFNVKEEHRWLFQNMYVDGVGRYETLIEETDKSLQSPWPAEAVAIYSRSFYEGFVCIAAWRLVDRGAISGLLNAIRNRVLEFALQIESEAPDAGEAEPGTQRVNPERAQTIFNNVIYGGQNVIAMAAGNVEQRVSVTQRPDWAALRARLLEMGLPEQTVADLATAIDDDSIMATAGEAGPATKRWLGEIAVGFGLGTLHIAEGVTAALIAAEVIQFLAGH